MCLKSDYIRISNVKLSTKIPDTCIETLENKCLENGFQHKVYGNFIVLKVPSVTNGDNLYTYTVFKKSLLKQCDVASPTQHVNITKVLLNNLDDALQTLASILLCKKADVCNYKIDNLTATCSLGRKFDIQNFLERNPSLPKVTFNPEKFPGCFLSFNKKKAVLFRSGVINILACKSLEEIKEVFSWISKITVHT